MSRFRQISPDVTECGCLKAIVLFKPGKAALTRQISVCVFGRAINDLSNWESVEYIFTVANTFFPQLSQPGDLNKDPTVWLDGARPPAINLIMCLTN